jgi:uncharacterized repeat protein (TIGR01451 family)
VSRGRSIVFLIISAWALSSGLRASTYTTYAAWSDAGNNQQGHMYIYTGNYPSTDVTLYNAATPNTAMTAVYCGFPVLGVGPYQPLAEVGSCPPPATGGFGNEYFRCASSNPIIWEVEEPIYSSEADSHDFLAAADTNTYIGAVFMTYMRHDGRSGATSDYGDQSAIINPGNTPITVTVRKWTGTPPAGSWGAVLITSPSIPAKGVWMYAPSDPGTHDRGGTMLATEGHYRFDVTGGTGMLYKGNTFSPYIAPGNRDNLVLFGPDINTGAKVGTDLVGAVTTDGGAPHIVINNQSSATATYQILKFNPTTPGFCCVAGISGPETIWPVNGNDPSGTWAVVYSASIPPLSSDYFNAGANMNAGYYRVQSVNGEPLSAEFGSAILQQTWCDGDYLFASDTRLAFGQTFNLGGKFFTSQVTGDPVQLHVVAPTAGTVVHVWVDGSISGPSFYNMTQTASANDVGLAFPFVMPGSTYETWTCHIVASNIVYAYVMSTTDASTKGGETFFSVPPPISPILLAQKSVNKSVATIGDTVSYTLVANNPGSNAVTNGQLWDTLPPGTNLVWTSLLPSVSTPPYYLWNLGSVAGNSAITVNLAVQITAGVQLEVKHNTATAKSQLTGSFPSNDAPVTILIPGANLTKSVSKAQAMPGDTLTYVLSYTNTTPPLPGTPKLDLQVHNNGDNTGDLNRDFSITNYSGGNIQITDLMICEWVNDNAPVGAITFHNYYGGNTNPWAGWGGPAWSGTATTFSPPQTLPSNRQANIQLCFQPTTAQLLPTGTSLTDINIDWSVSSPEVWDNHADDYSQANSSSYVEDHHFALYYQGKLVTEYSSPTTPDPETGLQPKYLFLEDPVPSPLVYAGSTPTASVVLPQLSWTLDAIAPGATVSFTWWGTIPGGTAGGTVINNTADGQDSSGPIISNQVSTLIGSANVSLVKSIAKNIYSFGDTVTYCIAWSNTGTAAVNVTITDPYDPILTFIGADNGGTNSGHTMTWALGNQPANSSGTVCFWAQITAYPSLPTPWAPQSELFAAADPSDWRAILARFGEARREPWWNG